MNVRNCDDLLNVNADDGGNAFVLIVRLNDREAFVQSMCAISEMEFSSHYYFFFVYQYVIDGLFFYIYGLVNSNRV